MGLVRLIWISKVFVLVLVAACSSNINRDYQLELDELLAENRRQQAIEAVATAGQQVYGERNKLLYHMDLGFVLHLAGEYEKSTAHFNAAEDLGNDLFTRSLTAEAGSLFSNDLLIPYAGEEFERVFVNLVNAMNYVLMGQLDEALVEVRRINVKLQTFRRELTGSYRMDPFARYLSGLLYEEAGNPDDARIAYRQAIEAYELMEEQLHVPVPSALLRDAGLADMESGSQEMGELIIIHYFGPAPRKVEQLVEVSVGKGMAHVYTMEVRSEEQKQVTRALSVAKGLASGSQVTIVYPRFEQPPLAAQEATVTVAGCGTISSEAVHNITQLALWNLKERMSRQWGRIVARAVLKFASAQAAGKATEHAAKNQLAGLLVKAVVQGVMSATEEADLRGWRTMPALVHMSRLKCPAGQYPVTVEHLGEFQTEEWHYDNVKIENGKKTFRVLATF